LTDLYLINQKVDLENGGENIFLKYIMTENYINKVINGDCIEVINDLKITSPY
jgi:hypothetical protein